ncbi:hypothetical protein DNTS_009835, partial [Danionella cerebrum]
LFSLSVEAIVEFDYQAQHEDELTIAVGDIISNIRKDEGGWWEGELDGRRGLFPDNFVRPTTYAFAYCTGVVCVAVIFQPLQL